MLPVKFLGIDAAQLAHSHRKVGLYGFNQQVIMIVHQAVAIAYPLIPHDNFANQ
jgi:hypothetical protein